MAKRGKRKQTSVSNVIKKITLLSETLIGNHLQVCRLRSLLAYISLFCEAPDANEMAYDDISSSEKWKIVVRIQ